MKSTVLLFFLYILSLSARASDFYLRLHDHSAFTIVFNRSEVVYGCRYFHMNNLVQGNYPLEVYNSSMTVHSPIIVPIYTGVVTIPAGCQMMAFLDKYHHLQAGNVIPLSVNPMQGYSSGGYSGYYNAYLGTNLNDSAGYQRALKVMEQLYNVKQKSSYLKHCIYFYGITSEKLSLLMKGFSFDTERMDLARFAYPFTLDRENYYLIFETLTFNSSKKELDQYLYYSSSFMRY